MSLHESSSHFQHGYTPEKLRQHNSWREARDRLERRPNPIVGAIAGPEDDTPAPVAHYRELSYRKRKAAINRVLVRAVGREKEAIAAFKVKSYALRASLRLTGRKIVTDTARAYGLSYDDLVGPSRLKEISVSRQEAMYRLRYELRMSYMDIARVLHRDDHTTARHGCIAHGHRLATIKRKLAADFGSYTSPSLLPKTNS